MKINSLTNILGYPQLVKNKQEKDGSHHQNKDQKHQKDNQDSGDFQEDGDHAAEISSAVAEFEADSLAQANGLHASVDGKGPGLKVILKDGSGTIVRQFSGEEFLKLREATSKQGRVPGKILDQKF